MMSVAVHRIPIFQFILQPPFGALFSRRRLISASASAERRGRGFAGPGHRRGHGGGPGAVAVGASGSVEAVGAGHEPAPGPRLAVKPHEFVILGVTRFLRRVERVVRIHFLLINNVSGIPLPGIVHFIGTFVCE